MNAMNLLTVCSPLGMKKQLPTVIHETASSFSEIYISGGRIGTTIVLAPKDLLQIVRGQYADIVRHDDARRNV